MSSGILPIVKQAALDAINNSNPTDLRYGTVVSVNPLKVKITSQLTLPASLLVVPKHLTDYEINVTIDSGYGWETKESSSHEHDIELSEKKMKIHNALQVNDKVALIRQMGGASYFILDKI